MKKVYALLLVAVMTVAMAVPTFAANSPEADPVVKTAAGVDVVAAAKEVKTSVAAASVVVPSEQLAKQVVSVTLSCCPAFSCWIIRNSQPLYIRCTASCYIFKTLIHTSLF